MLGRRKEEFKTRKLELRKETLLTAKIRNFKKPSRQKKKGKKPQGKHIDVSKLECYNCHKIGHFAKDCRQPKRKFKRRLQASTAKEEEYQGYQRR